MYCSGIAEYILPSNSLYFLYSSSPPPPFFAQHLLVAFNNNVFILHWPSSLITITGHRRAREREKTQGGSARKAKSGTAHPCLPPPPHYHNIFFSWLPFSTGPVMHTHRCNLHVGLTVSCSSVMSVAFLRFSISRC